MSEITSMKELFDSHSTIGKLTVEKLDQIKKFYDDFIRKNNNHIEFFGGVLVGTRDIKWVDSDSIRWIDEICELDDFNYLKDLFLKLKDVNAKHRVASNALNNSFIWLVHRVMSDESIPYKARHSVSVSILSAMQCKFITYHHNKAFGRYLASEELADEVYQDLTMRNNIKKLTSWKALIEYRADNWLDKHYKFYDTFIKYKDNEDNVGVLVDIYNATKNHYILFSGKYMDRAKGNSSNLSTNKMFETIDEDKVLKDYTNDSNNFVSKVEEVYLNENEFIKDELKKLTLELIPRAIDKNLTLCLDTILKDAKNKKNHPKYIINISKEFVPYMFNYMRREHLDEDLTQFVLNMRNLVRSSTSNEKEMVELKKYVSHVVKRSLKIRHQATLGATRTSVSMYIILRLITIKHYN